LSFTPLSDCTFATLRLPTGPTAKALDDEDQVGNSRQGCLKWPMCRDVAIDVPRIATHEEVPLHSHVREEKEA
jgi:hypothetical protein